MARVLQSYKFGKKPTARLYPWDEWTDGRTWKATKGKDFHTTVDSFRVTLRSHAHRHGQEVKVEILTEGAGPARREHVVFQFGPSATLAAPRKVKAKGKRKGMGGPKSGLTPRSRAARDDAIIAAYQQGYSLPEVGEQFGLHHTAVRRILIVNDIPRRAKGSTRSPKSSERLAARNADIIASYKAGTSAPVIAKRHSIAVGTVYNIVNEAHITRPTVERPTRTLALEKKVIAAYRKGNTIRDVGERFGLNREVVRQILIKHDVPRRPNPILNHNR